MSQADHGTGALYIIMDAIKHAKAEKEQEKQGWDLNQKQPKLVSPLKSAWKFTTSICWER